MLPRVGEWVGERVNAMGWGLRGDSRLALRFERVCDDIAASGSLVIRKLSRGRSAEVAAHRFLGSPSVQPEAILADFAGRTGAACRGRRIVAAQDTTEINFSGADRSRRGLGPAGDGKSLGFFIFIHAVAAVDADDEALLGVAGARIWSRAPGRVDDRQKRALKDKESERWIEGAATAAATLAQAAGVVVVGDRESDIYQVFTRKPADVDLLVRVRGDRRLLGGGLLFEAGAGFEAAFETTVEVSPRQRPGRPRSGQRGLGDTGRLARVAVAFGPVTIAKPKTGRACPDPKHVDLNLIVAGEIGAPESGPPLLWRLLTTLPVNTDADAKEAIRLYRLRWRIEQLFRALKRDGLALEETQVETAPRLFNLAALALGAAARIIQLTDARDASRRPATDVLDESLIEATDAIGATLEGKTERQKNPHPIGTLSWLAWIRGRLGGWNCYYKPPGPKTIAEGWRRLCDKLDGYAIATGKALV